MSPAPHRRAVSIRALLIPADLQRRCAVLELVLTAAALSDAIGGGLLDDALTDTIDGAGYCLYADADRIAQGLPDNPRAVLLAARLGWIHLADRVQLLGDILITGADDTGNDTDLPYVLVEAAHRTGLLPCYCNPQAHP
jgi:hypothetical protein